MIPPTRSRKLDGGSHINAVTGTLTVADTGGTTITNANAGAFGLDIQNSSATIDFDDTTVTKTASGTGVNLNGNTGAIIFNTLAITTSAGTALIADASNSLTVTNADGSSISASGGPAITSTGSGWNATFSSVSSSGSPTQGINLVNATGTLTINGGTLATAAGTTFAVGGAAAGSGGTATISYGGTIAQATSGQRPILVQNRTAGTLTFSGAITATAPGVQGVLLNANGGSTNSFTGGVNLSTGTSPAFVATGGGAVNVVDPPGALNNTITTTTGRGVQIENVNFGTSGITFERVTTNGAVNGIRLVNNGVTGFYTISGNGTDDSGGTITASTEDAILLNNTGRITLNEMSLVNSGQSHIDATSVDGLAVHSIETDLSIDHGLLGNGITDLLMTGSTWDRGGIGSTSCNVNGVNVTNLLGTSSVSTSTFRRSNTVQFRVLNDSATNLAGAPDSLTVSGLNFNTHNQPNASSTVCAGDHLSVAADTGGNFRLTVEASSGATTVNEGGTAATGGGIGVQATAQGSGRMEASVTGLKTSNNTAGVVIVASATSNIRFNVFGNKTANGTGISSTGSLALALTCTTTGTCEGAFNDNTIAHTAGTSTNAMQVVVEGNGTGRVAISNNVVSGNFQRGLHAQSRVGTGSSNLSLNVSNNTYTGTDAGGLQALNFETSASGDTSIVNTMCLNLANNNASMAGGGTAYRLLNRANDVFQLQGLTQTSTSTASDVQSWVTTTKNNVGSPISVTATAPYVTSAGCPGPTLP